MISTIPFGSLGMGSSCEKMPSQESTVHGHFERKLGNPVAHCSGFLCATEPHGFGKVGVANI